jgi:hypothetical protein
VNGHGSWAVRAAVWIAVLGGCSASRAVSPLGKGNTAITTSMGGPVVSYAGVPLPVPIGSVGAAHGVSDRTNIYGSFYWTPVLLFGIPGADLGVATELFGPMGARPRLMAGATTHVFFGDTAAGDPRGGVRVFPDLSAIGSWPIGPHDRSTVWTGLDLLVQTAAPADVFLSPLVGAEVRPGRVGLRAELKWLAATVDNLQGVPDWYGIGHRGALSLQLGVDIHLGDAGRAPGKGGA